MAQTTQTGVSMDDLDLFSYDNVSKDREKRKHSRHRGFSMNNKERHMVNFESICQVSNTLSTFICMRDDDDFMAPVYELGGQLIDVTLDASRLREEEVADHSNVVRHSDPNSQKILLRFLIADLIYTSHLASG